MKQLVELQKHTDELKAAGVQVIGVSYDSEAILKRLTDKKGVKLPLLSDKDSKVIKAYGLLNEKGKGRTAGIPHPGTVLVDSKGVVRGKLFVSGFRSRHTTAQLIDAVKKLDD